MNKDFNLTNYQRCIWTTEGRKRGFPNVHLPWTHEDRVVKKPHNKLLVVSIGIPAFHHYPSLARGKADSTYVTCLQRVYIAYPWFSLTFSNKPCNFINYRNCLLFIYLHLAWTVHVSFLEELGSSSMVVIKTGHRSTHIPEEPKVS